MDGWSGKITPITDFKVNGDRITLKISLSRDNGMLVAISGQPNRFGPVQKTSSPRVFDPPVDLTRNKWHLVVEDWQPANPYASTFGPAAAQTKKNQLEMDIEGLKVWPEIPELKNSAGLGTYTTMFDPPAIASGATLSLGDVFDTFTVEVNGHPVSVNQLSAEADLGQLLKQGCNTLTVRVATTLNNRLAALDDEVKARGLVQPYGLIGPVRITPYTPQKR